MSRTHIMYFTGLLQRRFWATLICAIMFGVIMGSSAMAREKATRAPLSIIPKNKVSFSLNRDLENQNEMQQASLPQLKPGGVNLTRPVRAVAALPGGRGVVQVGELGNLEDTEIGLETGLGPDLWQASRFSNIARLMKRLPAHYDLAVTHELAVALMTSTAAPPPGLAEGKNFFALRLAYLLQLGEIDAVRQLIDMTGAQQRDAAVTKIAAEAALIQGDTAQACSSLGQFSRLTLSPALADFALQLRAYCQIEAGDMLAASLTLDVARETGMKDQLFLDAVFALTANVPFERSQAPSGQKLTTLHAVLLLKLDAPLFASEVELLNPALVNKFSKNFNQPENIRLLIAQRGVMVNRVEASYLRALMDMVELGYIQPTALNALSAPQANLQAPPPAPVDEIILKARQIRIIDEPVTLKGKILALEDLMQSALAGQSWELTVELVAPNLRAIEPNPEFADFALYAVPAFIHLDDIDRAAQWHAVLLEQQSGLPSAKSRNLNGLIRLMEHFETLQADETTPKSSSSQVAGLTHIDQNDTAHDATPAILGVPPMEAILMSAVLKTGTKSENIYVKSEIGLLPLFGFQVPDYLAQEAKVVLTDKVLLRSLDDMETALKAGERGAAILHALIAIGRMESQANYIVPAMQRVLLALNDLGLTQEARVIARKILTRQAAMLVQGD
ncbi:MAG: hypothetical protein ACON41_04255 [Parvibaculales bacterium]